MDEYGKGLQGCVSDWYGVGCSVRVGCLFLNDIDGIKR